MSELKPCPFCGCHMIVNQGKYPNGDDLIEPFGFHDADCPLYSVAWYTYPEDGWTAENLVQRWNRRATE